MPAVSYQHVTIDYNSIHFKTINVLHKLIDCNIPAAKMIGR